MNEWKQLRLGDHAESFAGGTPNRDIPEYFGGAIPWVKSSELNQRRICETEEYLTEAGLRTSAAKWIAPKTVLIALYGATAAQVSYLEIAATANQAVLAIHPDSEFETGFLFYALSFAKQRLLYSAQGSGQPNLNKGIVDNIKIYTPPAPIQNRIAEMLSTVDEAIEQTEALIAKQQQIKEGLMHDLFTRGVTPDGRLRRTQTEAPALYHHTRLGWIPKEWEAATIGDLFTRRSERGIAGLPIMSIIMGGGMVPRDSVDRRVESNLTPQQHLLVREGDIAYNMMRMWQGVLGRAKHDGLISPAYVVMKPGPRIQSEFAEHLLSTKSSIARFKQLSFGVVDDRLRLYASDLVRVPLAVPKHLDEQERISKRLRALMESISTETKQLAKLRQQKQGMMRDLLTGRVPVPVPKPA